MTPKVSLLRKSKKGFEFGVWSLSKVYSFFRMAKTAAATNARMAIIPATNTAPDEIPLEALTAGTNCG